MQNDNRINGAGMTEINRRYFESLMAEKKLSLRGLAHRMGLGHSQLSLTFSGARRAQLDEAAKLAQIFGEPLYKVVEALGVEVRPTNGRRISVIGSITGDGTVSMYAPDIIERTTAPDDLPDEGVAIQARTTGSPLEWLDGAVFFSRKPGGVDPAILGRLSLLKVKNGPAAIGMVKRGYRENTNNIAGPYHAESVDLEWATPILFTRN